MQDHLEINTSLAKHLVEEQFPEFKHLHTEKITPGGIDNVTFRLGSEMLLRFPSAKGYAPQVEKEQKYLPFLASYLSLQIPKPLAMGKPSKLYPWNWSIFNWIEGTSADQLELDDSSMLEIAKDSALFIKELHSIPIENAPLSGKDNYYRGSSFEVYETQALSAIAQLDSILDQKAASDVIKKAASSKWIQSPVWVHGDFSSGNMLVYQNRLKAVIDFGCMAIGDPACDLVLAWTFFKGESSSQFKETLGLDKQCFQRARGWALWKACLELVGLEDMSAQKAKSRIRIAKLVIEEDKQES